MELRGREEIGLILEALRRSWLGIVTVRPEERVMEREPEKEAGRVNDVS